jgi:hypothetical protein
MGSVDPKEAAMMHWAAANQRLSFVEFLTGLGNCPRRGPSSSSSTKVGNNNGGPGRAIAILPTGDGQA